MQVEVEGGRRIGFAADRLLTPSRHTADPEGADGDDQ